MNPNANEFKLNVTANEWKPPSTTTPVTSSDSLIAPVSVRAGTPTRARLAATPTTQDPMPTKSSASLPISGKIALFLNCSFS